MTPDAGEDPVWAPVSGPSFPVAVKGLATAWMVLLVLFGAAALSGSSGPAMQALIARSWPWLAAGLLVAASGYWGILTSRTSIDGHQIEQRWVWRKRVGLDEITQVKLIRLPGLDWLIAPRLVVRTGFGLATFHAADPAVLARFRLLAHGR